MTLKEKGRKPTPDMPATGVGPSLNRIEWVEFEQKYPRIFSLAAQCDDVIVPVKSKMEWRVVVTVPGQRQQRYPKRNAERAQKAITNFAKDRARSVYYRDATMHIEQREVTEWHTQ